MVSHARNECILAFLSPGAIVGEMSIIDRLPRSASVVAVRPAVLSFLSSADFKALAKKRPQVYESLVTLLGPFCRYAAGSRAQAPAEKRNFVLTITFGTPFPREY